MARDVAGQEEARPYRPSRAASTSDRRRLTEWSALTISSLKKSAPDTLPRSHFLCACSENKSVAYPATIPGCSAHCASSMAAPAARQTPRSAGARRRLTNVNGKRILLLIGTFHANRNKNSGHIQHTAKLPQAAICTTLRAGNQEIERGRPPLGGRANFYGLKVVIRPQVLLVPQIPARRHSS